MLMTGATAVGRPILRDVSDGGGEDARRDEPLQQPPEDQPAEGGGAGGGAGRHGEQKNRDENHALAIHTLGERAEQRRCNRDTESRGTDRPAYGGLRGVKEVFQQGQKRLRCIEREEGDEAADEYADHAPDRVKRMTIPDCCIRKRCRGGRCAFAQRQRGRGGIVRAAGIGHGRATFKIRPFSQIRFQANDEEEQLFLTEKLRQLSSRRLHICENDSSSPHHDAATIEGHGKN